MRALVSLIAAVVLGAGVPALGQQAPAAEAAPNSTPDPAAVPVKPPVRPLTLAAPALAGGLLTLDPVALYEGSVWFRRVQDTLGRESAALSAENDRLAVDLAQQERELTDHRTEMTPEDFRAKATAFDARVVEVRRTQEDKAMRLNALAEAERKAFFRTAMPVFAKVMADHAAVAILDRQSVFISAEAIDVTEELRRRIDDEVGEGEAQPLPAGMAGMGAGDAAPVSPDAASSAPEPLGALPATPGN